MSYEFTFTKYWLTTLKTPVFSELKIKKIGLHYCQNTYWVQLFCREIIEKYCFEMAKRQKKKMVIGQFSTKIVCLYNIHYNIIYYVLKNIALSPDKELNPSLLDTCTLNYAVHAYRAKFCFYITKLHVYLLNLYNAI